MSVGKLECSAGGELKDAVRALNAGFSIEVTPRQMSSGGADLAGLLPAGTQVYITYLPNSDFSETIAAARKLVDVGMSPVPHLAARSITDLSALDMMIRELAGVGVHHVLVIGGSLDKPVGDFGDSIQVLRSGVLERYGIDSVDVAGHPEGSADIGDNNLAQAVDEKNQFAVDTGIRMQIVTQFSFDAVPIIAWERRLRAAGNKLPIRIGLPGLASPASLIRFGIACGIGASLKVIRKQAGGLLKLATSGEYHPDATILGLANAAMSDRETLVSGVHYFPFGTLTATAQWAGRLVAGQFEVHEDRLEVDA